MEAVKAVFRSWNTPRAITYRRMNDIPGDWGTAVNVQTMVFGNKGATSGTGVAPTDADLIHILQKFAKELDEEKEGYVKAGRTEQAEATEKQKQAIVSFLPKQLSEEEVRKIYASLEDKSMPAVMKHFKTNYAGQVDMGLVSKVARGL